MKKIFYTLIIIAIISSCDEDSKCNNCGDIYGGYITMKVTANDLTKYQGLAQFDNIDVGTCIQAYIREEQLFLESIRILDKCCCEL